MRDNVNTEWEKRERPTDYITPLKDAYRVVCDQNNIEILIYSSVGKAIPGTRWKQREKVI